MQETLSEPRDEEGVAWRAIPGPLSKRKRRLDSLEARAPKAPHPHSMGKGLPVEGGLFQERLLGPSSPQSLVNMRCFSGKALGEGERGAGDWWACM